MPRAAHARARQSSQQLASPNTNKKAVKKVPPIVSYKLLLFGAILLLVTCTASNFFVRHLSARQLWSADESAVEAILNEDNQFTIVSSDDPTQFFLHPDAIELFKQLREGGYTDSLGDSYCQHIAEAVSASSRSATVAAAASVHSESLLGLSRDVIKKMCKRLVQK